MPSFEYHTAKRRLVQVRVPKATWARWKRVAKEQGLTVSGLVRVAVNDYCIAHDARKLKAG